MALAHAGNALVRHPLTRRQWRRILENGDAAFPEMLAAIDAAKHIVGLSFYIFDDDVTGRAFVPALIAAHERGVAVRVLIDGVGGGYFRSGVYDVAARVPACRWRCFCIPGCPGGCRFST